MREVQLSYSIYRFLAVRILRRVLPDANLQVSSATRTRSQHRLPFVSPLHTCPPDAHEQFPSACACDLGHWQLWESVRGLFVVKIRSLAHRDW